MGAIVAERAHPEVDGFGSGQKYRSYLFDRYGWAKEYTDNKIVLDIPTGIGWGASLLTNARQVYGIDSSTPAIVDGIERYSNVKFIVGDMCSIPLQNKSIDVLVCLDGYEHIRKEQQLFFIKEVSRILKLNGVFLVNIPRALKRDGKSPNPYHLHEPTVEEFVEDINSKFILNSLELNDIGGYPNIRAVLGLK